MIILPDSVVLKVDDVLVLSQSLPNFLILTLLQSDLKSMLVKRKA